MNICHLKNLGSFSDPEGTHTLRNPAGLGPTIKNCSEAADRVCEMPNMANSPFMPCSAGARFQRGLTAEVGRF